MALVDPLRYDNHRDVEMRLYASIVRYQGRAFFIDRTRDNLTVSGRDLQLLDTAPTVTVHSSDEELDISSPPLGYLNHEMFGEAFYISRTPRRRNKQGFCENSANITPENPGNGLWSANMIYHPYMGKTINGDYPSFKEALDKLVNLKIHSIAFDRRFCLIRDQLDIVKVHHMARPIGYLSPESGKVIFPQQFVNKYFLEALEKKGAQV